MPEDAAPQEPARATATPTVAPEAVAQPASKEAPAIGFRFVKAAEKDGDPLDWDSGIRQARAWLSEALNAKNVAFLLGAGCSSLWESEEEKGVLPAI